MSAGDWHWPASFWVRDHKDRREDHAARFNAAGQEFSRDHFDPNTPLGEARFHREIWLCWRPDAIIDNQAMIELPAT